MLNILTGRVAVLASTVLALAFVFGTVTTSAFAQNDAWLSSPKWRPRNGLYAERIADCGDSGDIDIDLGEQFVVGNEWSCKIRKLTDTAPGEIRLDLICNDYNLALFINDHDPNPYEREFAEIMQFRRIDNKATFVRKTQDGKFESPGGPMVYCPKKDQQAYQDQKARDKAEHAQKKKGEGN